MYDAVCRELAGSIFHSRTGSALVSDSLVSPELGLGLIVGNIVTTHGRGPPLDLDPAPNY
jgi:hypothetical protein